MIISRTPFRVSFFGGGTDFPGFYAKHGGAVLTTTIDKFCYITIHSLQPFFKYRFKANYAQAEAVQKPIEFKHPLIRECLLYLRVRDGLEIAHVADLPGRTGLGSSSSFTVGLLHTLHAYMGNDVAAEQLAREAIIIERERVGDPGGHQDQYAAAYGGFMRLDFTGDQTITVKKIEASKRRIQDLQSYLMMFYMGVEQTAEHILNEQKKRVKKNTAALLEMLEMVNEAERIVSGRTQLTEFGKLLHESWLRKKSLSPEITNSEIDRAYEAARGAGALGGKLLGAGGRGFLLVFAEPGKHAAIRRKLRKLQEVDFSFTPEGSRIIFDSGN